MGGKVQKRSFWDKNMIREELNCSGANFLKIFLYGKLGYPFLNGRGLAKNEKNHSSFTLDLE